MYLKNISQTAAVTINTVVGKVGLNPQEVIKLEEKILPPLPSSLREATEEEYLTFREKRYGVVEASIESQTNATEQHVESVEEVSKTTEEQSNSSLETSEKEEIVETPKEEETSETIKSIEIPEESKGLISKLFNNKLFSVNGETEIVTPVVEPIKENTQVPIMDSLIVQETTCNTEKEELEKQLETLKETWKQTKQAKRKEKITKQIKELQKQIDKLG